MSLAWVKGTVVYYVPKGHRGFGGEGVKLSKRLYFGTTIFVYILRPLLGILCRSCSTILHFENYDRQKWGQFSYEIISFDIGLINTKLRNIVQLCVVVLTMLTSHGMKLSSTQKGYQGSVRVHFIFLWYLMSLKTWPGSLSPYIYLLTLIPSPFYATDLCSHISFVVVTP